MSSTKEVLLQWKAYLSHQLQAGWTQMKTSGTYDYLDRRLYREQILPFYSKHVESHLSPSLIHNATIAASTLLLYGIGRKIYRTGFMRIKSNAQLTEKDFSSQRKLIGRVPHVGDSDNFRIIHFPPLLSPIYSLLPMKKKKALSEETIHVRLAGIDAPECAHFGMPGQPYGEHVKEWLTKFLLNSKVNVYLLKKDQYGRAVCSVYVRKWWYYLWMKRLNVSEYMLKKGYAVCYEGEGEVYIEGSPEKNKRYKMYYKALEERAKRSKKGMWAKASTSESPKDYKRRMKKEQ
ncbi:hypothetical protein FDP41_004918 [Naegleria fowleri]|uniref:TNase-like domain-containing protein n=1 Tax=Naegleria fowleri TaxID=5763 RepID=A0A6A5BEG7_NAEFO|nr:uncharacterized protein FDP41_004918 [Naegleria fowleri]KAF0976243.1 hypothetical protein FDP41_004918 [Naegleria fowleri]